MNNIIEPKNVLEKIKFWQSFVKIITFNLIMAFIILYVSGIFPNDKLVFVFSSIAVIISMLWWFWTIYTISLLSFIINRSSKNIKEVIGEVQTVRNDINDLKNNSRNRKRRK
jgi:uncharacterized membrane protein YagU involved in acid resistance